MKYVVIRVTSRIGEREIPVIFPNALVHSQMAEATIAAMKIDDPRSGYEVVSAGEISSMNINPECHGKSVSLGNIKSREGVDDSLIRRHDYFHGIL